MQIRRSIVRRNFHGHAFFLLALQRFDLLNQLPVPFQHRIKPLCLFISQVAQALDRVLEVRNLYLHRLEAGFVGHGVSPFGVPVFVSCFAYRVSRRHLSRS